MTNSDLTAGRAVESGYAAELVAIRAELRAVARDLLGKAGAAAEPEWQHLAAAGWLGLEVPGELDGADATFAEAAVIAEELGRAAARTPYLGAIVLGVGALREASPGEARDDLLAQAAAGESVPVAVVPDGAAFRLTKSQGEERIELTGHAPFLPDAGQASLLLIVAYPDPSGGGDGVGGDSSVVGGAERGPVLVALRPDTPGLRVAGQPVLDETRQLAEVGADRVTVAPGQVWRFSGDPETAIRRLRDRAAVALACDSLGVAEAMLAATVSYAKVRQQFGRPIGSFQAVKHACADMLVQVTVARQLVVAAVAALAEPRETRAGHEADAGVAASMAKSYACAAAVEVAGKAMQLHGGVGYTRESGIHAYLKRAALNRDLFGSPAAHRARLAGRYQAASGKTHHMVD
jgi:alkylation response protein AidB-like acyl-CoA dehydrogenase